MPPLPHPEPHPALLPPGSLVGPWRVVAWAGRGVHGAVYRAVPADNEHAAPVALKLALLPRDPRFARETRVLSILHHPNIPGLVDQGSWQHPSGTLHPYFAMQWVDGVPMYDWARLNPPSASQVLRMLAQLASALQAIHALGVVHRDVKGDNVLVSREDGRAVLTDFGSCYPPGAPTLTPPGMVPGTPAYLSPEASLLELQSLRDPSARYRALPADDVYALGVTACRLLTGKYPEPGEPFQDERGHWHLESVVIPVALQNVESPLLALVLRMLSVRPEERGTAEHLTQMLEQASSPPATERPAPSSAVSLAPLAAQPSPPGTAAERRIPKALMRCWRPGLAVTAVALVVAIASRWTVPGVPAHKPPDLSREAPSEERPDAGTTGLGETAASASPLDSVGIPSQEVFAEETPPEPQPGQAQPDAKGRCPLKRQVSLNGGCWAKLSLSRDECEENGGHIFMTACYLPVFPHGHPATSEPTNKADPKKRR